MKNGILLSTIIGLMIGMMLIPSESAQAQIYEPEGLNMPGGWNGWTNPPVNNLALASYTQVPGGRVVKFAVGIQRWQTIFSVAASGGDIIGGTYDWLFTSGPTSSPWNNKWANVSVTMNLLQTYTKEGATNNNITVTNDKWYTMNWEDNNYTNTRAIFMETSADPVQITNVSVPATVYAGDSVTITITLSQTPSPEEVFYIRFSGDNWNSSSAREVTLAGATGTAVIPPGWVAGTEVSCYAFSSTLPDLDEEFDLYTIRLNNNSGANYSFLVTNPPSAITFANLDSPATGSISLGDPFFVFGNALIPGITGQITQAPGLEAWFGYSTTDSDPSGWTNWDTAAFFGPVSGMDGFVADLGASLASADTFYYTTRFRLNGGSYLYGGYSASGGGFWNGTTNVSGILIVQTPAVPMNQTVQNVTVPAEESFCYNAKANLTLAGGGTFFLVQSGGSAVLISGQYINLLPGAKVEPGGYLHGYITTLGEYCPTAKSPATKEAAVIQTGKIKSGDLSVMLYPNPATDVVNIRLTGAEPGTDVKIEIFGMQGNRIREWKFQGSDTFSVPVTGFPEGLYCIRVVNEDLSQTKLMIKE